MLRPRLLIVPLAAVLLSACVIAPYPYARQPAYYQPAGEGSDVVVDVAPPPPYAEVIPAIPFLGAVWLGGYWSWNRGRHAWVSGRWEQPRAGYGWRPHTWAPQGGRWHLHSGGWERR
jgi:hypothetical protein